MNESPAERLSWSMFGYLTDFPETQHAKSATLGDFGWIGEKNLIQADQGKGRMYEKQTRCR
jgi:hypothetical protein